MFGVYITRRMQFVSIHRTDYDFFFFPFISEVISISFASPATPKKRSLFLLLQLVCFFSSGFVYWIPRNRECSLESGFYLWFACLFKIEFVTQKMRSNSYAVNHSVEVLSLVVKLQITNSRFFFHYFIEKKKDSSWCKKK